MLVRMSHRSEGNKATHNTHIRLYNVAFSEVVENPPSESTAFFLSTNLNITFTAKDVIKKVGEYYKVHIRESHLCSKQ
jgi:hypothetical protein